MVEKKSNLVSSKILLAGVALFGLIGLSVLLLWRAPCEGIFAQTAPELKVNLKVIENEGAFAVSRDKIQELSESAQKVALHLKTCCTVLDGGKLNPEQFQQCIDKASVYEKQIAHVAQQIKETVKAKENGSTDVLQSKIAGISQAIETATGKAQVLAQFVERDITPTVVASTKQETDAEKTPNESPPEAMASHEEQESNNQITNPNVIQFGGRIRGVITSAEDRDYYKFRTPQQMSGKTRVILRKLSTGGFTAEVQAYDQVERKIGQSYAYSDDSVTFAFETNANSDYYIMIKSSSGQEGPYELEVREE